MWHKPITTLHASIVIYVCCLLALISEGLTELAQFDHVWLVWCLPMEPFNEINLGVLGRRIGN